MNKAFVFILSALILYPRRPLRPADPDYAALCFAWNGVTQIDSNEIWAGPDTTSLSLVDTVPRTGFETSTTLDSLSPESCVFQARPVHQLGTPTPFSNYTYHLVKPECRALNPNSVHVPFIRTAQ